MNLLTNMPLDTPIHPSSERQPVMVGELAVKESTRPIAAVEPTVPAAACGGQVALPIAGWTVGWTGFGARAGSIDGSVNDRWIAEVDRQTQDPGPPA